MSWGLKHDLRNILQKERIPMSIKDTLETRLQHFISAGIIPK